MVFWHALGRGEVLNRLGSGNSGLSEMEAKARLEKYGLNELKEVEKTTVLQMFLEQFSDALVLVLIAAGFVQADAFDGLGVGCLRSDSNDCSAAG